MNFSLTSIRDDGRLFLIKEGGDVLDAEHTCNIWVIKGKNVTLVIDAGHGYGNLWTFLVDNGFHHNFKVLLTHGHFDHSGGAIHFNAKDVYGAFPVEDEPEASRLYRNDSFFDEEVAQRFHYCFHKKIQPFPPFFEIDDEDATRLECVPTPGHTGGSYCFYVSAWKALFTGDTIYKEWDHLPRVNLPSENMTLLKLTRQKLFETYGDVIEVAYPGHYDVLKSGVHDFEINHTCFKRILMMSPSGVLRKRDRAFMKKLIEAEDALAEATRDHLTKGVHRDAFYKEVEKILTRLGSKVPMQKDIVYDTQRRHLLDVLKKEHALSTRGIIAVALDERNIPMYWVTGSVEEEGKKKEFYLRGLARSQLYEFSSAEFGLKKNCAQPLLSYVLWKLKPTVLYAQPTEGTRKTLHGLDPQGVELKVMSPYKYLKNERAAYTEECPITVRMMHAWRLGLLCVKCQSNVATLIQVDRPDKVFCNNC
jgi:glyoxylase-like metal-dependent hydrolase (beta-lactamase superfamily II)